MMRGNFRMAISGVKSAKWRSLLTMLGIIIGIVSVVTMVGIGEGIKRQVSQQIGHFGNDLITIRPGTADTDSTRVLGSSDVLFGMGAVGGFGVADVEAVQKTPEAGKVAPLGVVPGTVQADDQTLRGGVVIATSSQFPAVLNQSVRYGQFWDDKNEDSQFAVIGRQTAESLFKDQAPLGRTFTFRGQTFMVRGVLDEFRNVPLSPTAEFDNAIFIPYKAAARLTKNNSHLYVVLAKPVEGTTIEAAAGAITDSLREAHGGQTDFTVLTPAQNIASSSRLLGLLSAWIMAVAIISLIIGGVGLMNIMLVSVTERMHEIGVRKAIGATGRQILGQFMLEAMVLSLVGGLLGIIFALAAQGLLHVYTDLKPVISWEAVLAATGVALVVGLVFGTLPALKAARKAPIEALRHE
ncbi:MAG: ABC transporter permease [Candidatus Saccharimonadales bacterium]